MTTTDTPTDAEIAEMHVGELRDLVRLQRERLLELEREATPSEEEVTPGEAASVPDPAVVEQALIVGWLRELADAIARGDHHDPATEQQEAQQ